MKRGWALVAGAAVMMLAACGQAKGDESTREAVSSALGSAAASGADVNLADVVSGEWTRVLFLCPYGSEEEVNKRLAFAWDDYPGPDDSEGQVTFVFASNSAVVTWATVGRNVGDPCSGPTPLDMTEKASAVFRVAQTETTADGRPFYALLPKR